MMVMAWFILAWKAVLASHDLLPQDASAFSSSLQLFGTALAD
jgi:hypothetical protein